MTRASPGWAALLATLLLTSIAVPGARADAPGTPAPQRVTIGLQLEPPILDPTANPQKSRLSAIRAVEIAGPFTLRIVLEHRSGGLGPYG